MLTIIHTDMGTTADSGVKRSHVHSHGTFNQQETPSLLQNLCARPLMHIHLLVNPTRVVSHPKSSTTTICAITQGSMSYTNQGVPYVDQPNLPRPPEMQTISLLASPGFTSMPRMAFSWPLRAEHFKSTYNYSCSDPDRCRKDL
jgi:hypothetical protein